MAEDKEFLTLAEVSQQLHISRSKLYTDRRTGNLRVFRFGRVIRIRRIDLERYVRAAQEDKVENQSNYFERVR